MANRCAIVTLAAGAYADPWQRFCRHHWQHYADTHGLDLIPLFQPLDCSPRALARSPAWQKCLILGQDFSQRYEQIVWVDADIAINVGAAPNVFDGVPVDKVGAVAEGRFSHLAPDQARAIRQRWIEVWPHAAGRQTNARDYYHAWGLPNDCDRVLNSGVLVLSPQHHRALLERVYNHYEEKPGREWHMEMRPLSYELNRAGVVHWLDARFNVMWFEQQLLYYLFLLQPQGRKQKLAAWFGLDNRRKFIGPCIRHAFARSYFLHVGGLHLTDLKLIAP